MKIKQEEQWRDKHTNIRKMLVYGQNKAAGKIQTKATQKNVNKNNSVPVQLFNDSLTLLQKCE